MNLLSAIDRIAFTIGGVDVAWYGIIIVIGMITSPYLSGMYVPRSLFAILQIKFASCVTSTGLSSQRKSNLLFISAILYPDQ